jgi:hypothetical protein
MRAAISTASAAAVELEDGLQRALGDLGLVGGVAGQKLRPLDQVVHRRRDVVAIGARAAEEGDRAGGRVPGGQRRQRALHLQLALVRRQIDRLGEQHLGRHRGEQRLHGRRPDGAQHLAAVGVGEGEITHQNNSAGMTQGILPIARWGGGPRNAGTPPRCA